MAGRLSIGASMDAPDKLNGISATAVGETTPEISFKVDSEGGGIVSSMNRTGSGELIVFCLEASI